MEQQASASLPSYDYSSSPINTKGEGFIQWIHGCQRAGLLPASLTPSQDSSSQPQPAQKSAATTAECGVSLAYLYDLSCRVSSLLPRDADTNTVVSRLICPLTQMSRGRTRGPRGRFWDLIPPEHTGKPHLYVIHPWGMCFREMVEQLVHSLAPGAERKSINEGGLYTQLYIWLDVLALNQNPGVNTHADVLLVKEVLRACPAGAAIVVDKPLLALTRSWCLYETWLTIHLKDITKLSVCLPVDMSLQELMKFEAACKHLDISFSDTTKSEDKTQILSQIRGTVGMKRMQTVLNEGLVSSVRAGLRWSQCFKDLTHYCALLLQADETINLQRVLHHIPELASDDKTLQDIQNIFDIITGNGASKLNEGAFTKVLEAAGFSLAEARSVYGQITQNDRDGVGLEEFKNWWINSSRQESLQVSRPPILSPAALADNLRRMKELLDRRATADKSFAELADLFKSALQDHLDGKTLQPGSSLGPSQLNGDWRQVANEVLSKLHCQDFRGTLSTLHGLLLWNRDSLDVNPDQVLRHDIKRLDMPAVFKALTKYLEIFIQMLQGHANHKQHCKSYSNFVDKLQSPDFLDFVMEKQAQGGSASMTTSGLKTELERHAVVRSMIALKYGEKEPIDNAMIAEAQISLGKILCLPKKSSPGSLDAIVPHSMSQSYLVTSATPERAKVDSQKPFRFRKLDLSSDVQTSVLLSLGPEAVAFYASQQSAAEAGAGAAAADGSNGEHDEGNSKAASGGKLPLSMPKSFSSPLPDFNDFKDRKDPGAAAAAVAGGGGRHLKVPTSRFNRDLSPSLSGDLLNYRHSSGNGRGMDDHSPLCRSSVNGSEGGARARGGPRQPRASLSGAYPSSGSHSPGALPLLSYNSAPRSSSNGAAREPGGGSGAGFQAQLPQIQRFRSGALAGSLGLSDGPSSPLGKCSSVRLPLRMERQSGCGAVVALARMSMSGDGPSSPSGLREAEAGIGHGNAVSPAD